ncbi:MAG: CPBP family intramembrane metalloprotease [Anaerolineales bacterium]|nr:CPBP family intramembrane metalloprotease [Anaerolineales bacterium]
MIRQISKQRVVYYVVFLFVLTLAAYYVSSAFSDSPEASLLIMWSPALAAIFASMLTRRSLKAIGWDPRPVKWLAAGWILPMLYAIPAYALVWFLGLGDIPNPTFLERARLTLNMQASTNVSVIVAAFFFITLVNLIPAMVFSLGEEIGWRGFLVPELTQWVGFRNASLLSGMLWAVWHLPGVLSVGYGAMGTPLWYRLVCFTTMVITTGVVMAWLRMKSNSIWPVVVMHALHNGLIQTFLDRITIDTGKTSYFASEFGAAMLPFLFVLAWYFWRRPLQVEDDEKKSLG